MSNNPALYDAVVSGIASSNNAWLSDPVAGHYIGEVAVADVIATKVDAQIPVIAGGVSISQRILMESVAKGVMSGRFPQSLTPADYTAVAAAIAALFVEMNTVLQDTSTGAGGVPVLTNTVFVDKNTAVLPANQNGSIGKPFSTITAALTTILATGGLLLIVPGDYSAEAAINVNPVNGVTLVNLAQVTMFINASGTSDQNVVLPQITIGSGVTVVIVGCILGITAISAGNLKLENSIIGANLTIGSDIEAVDSSFAPNVTINAPGYVSIYRSDIGINLHINTNQTAIPRIYDSVIAAGLIVTFDVAGGELLLDAFSANYWTRNHGSVVNGFITVIALGTIVVNGVVPVVAAGALGYLDIALAGTDLATIKQNTPVVVNPRSDLAAAGAGNGGLINSRISADGTLRLAFVGALAGGAADFTVSIP